MNIQSNPANTTFDYTTTSIIQHTFAQLILLLEKSSYGTITIYCNPTNRIRLFVIFIKEMQKKSSDENDFFSFKFIKKTNLKTFQSFMIGYQMETCRDLLELCSTLQHFDNTMIQNPLNYRETIV